VSDYFSTHRIRLHFRSLAGLHVPFQTILSSTQAVYSRYGIRIEMASGQSTSLSSQEAAKYLQIDSACNWSIESGELYDLQSSLGQFFSPFDITVIYVNQFADRTLGGCGGHIRGRPACVVAVQAGRWDTAHEVCHVLLGPSFVPVHENERNNLMYPNSSTSNQTPTLTTSQVEQIKKSPCCVRLARG
jgi:hypothetical protein